MQLGLTLMALASVMLENKKKAVHA